MAIGFDYDAPHYRELLFNSEDLDTLEVGQIRDIPAVHEVKALYDLMKLRREFPWDYFNIMGRAPSHGDNKMLVVIV